MIVYQYVLFMYVCMYVCINLLGPLCMYRGGVALDSRVGEYLEVVAAFESLVPEEVDFIVFAFLYIVQRVGLIPAGRKHIERYLAAD